LLPDLFIGATTNRHFDILRGPRIKLFWGQLNWLMYFSSLTVARLAQPQAGFLLRKMIDTPTLIYKEHLGGLAS
jgi:hypothetical protein